MLYIVAFISLFVVFVICINSTKVKYSQNDTSVLDPSFNENVTSFHSSLLSFIDSCSDKKRIDAANAILHINKEDSTDIDLCMALFNNSEFINDYEFKRAYNVYKSQKVSFLLATNRLFVHDYNDMLDGVKASTLVISVMILVVAVVITLFLDSISKFNAAFWMVLSIPFIIVPCISLFVWYESMTILKKSFELATKYSQFAREVVDIKNLVTINTLCL